MKKEEKRYTDKILGTVVVRKNKRCKSIILRIKDGMVVITIPSYCPYSKGLEALEGRREKLQENLRKKTIFFDEKTELTTLTFKTKIFRSERSNFYFSLKDRILYISVPEDTDFSIPEIQSFILAKVEYFLRLEATRYLPDRLRMLAEMHYFTFNEIKITRSKGRWGSCSAQKNINLSLYLMLLPSYLVDFVILHELCHTVEMNHGERFWKLLDKETGGKAKQYTKELKTQRTW